jgi:ribosomal peptide maturation radical SAM protein 1
VTLGRGGNHAEILVRSANLTSILVKGDCLIIVPPFADLDRPSLAAHLLQAYAQEVGATVRVLYGNVLLASVIGEEDCQALCYTPTSNLLGERLFARAAHGIRPLGHDWNRDNGLRLAPSWNESESQFSPADLIRLEASCHDWVDWLAAQVAQLAFPIVGCSTTFEQTAASIAILNRVKTHRPETISVLGGANCDGELAEGIHSRGSRIDFVFSGESDITFPRFLRSALDGWLPAARTVRGEPVIDMDRSPAPEFSEFYQQYARFLPDGLLAKTGDIWLPYETSRGCWWGEKHHCTFCGLNGSTMRFREKSPDKILTDLRAMTARQATNRIVMYDNIMPHSYFRSLLPRLETELPGLHIFFEQKANLTLDRFQILKRGGVAEIQPGIEALSTSLLKRMDKGVTASQNVAHLRYARSVDLSLRWNILYAFPGDRLTEYENTLELLPRLRHLTPPTGVYPLSIDRFSPYFDRPDDYGVTNIQPMEAYHAVLPAQADVWKSAYHFRGDYDSDSKLMPPVIDQIKSEVREWQAAWNSETEDLPVLTVTDIADDTYLLLDTRGLQSTEVFNFIDESTASVVLAGHRGARTPAAEWALAHQAAVELDDWIVPLATASPDLIDRFESRDKAGTKGAGRMAAVALEMI